MTREIRTPLSTSKVTPDQRRNAKDRLARALSSTAGLRGGVLKSLRQFLEVSQTDVARHIPARKPGRHGERTVGQHTISAIESEEIGMPRGFMKVYLRALDMAVRSQEAIVSLQGMTRQDDAA